MKNLRITIPASRDLDEISDYFLAQSIDAGDRFVETFNQICIGFNPLHCTCLSPKPL